MDSKRAHKSKQGLPAFRTSRRQLLTASGLLAVGALSGCLDRVTSATTNTGASPAAPFAGIGAYTGPSPTGEPTVYKLTPKLSSDTGDITLEAWVTSRAIAATCCFDYTGTGDGLSNRANYNNSRSNRSTIYGPGDADSDADGLDDTVELRSSTLELENELLSQTKAAADSISKRSARTGRRGIADMGDTIQDIQATLERCSEDVCVTVRTHADNRAQLTRQATEHVENGDWESAAEAVQEVQTIVESDIDRLESSLHETTASEGTGEVLLEEDRDMPLLGDVNGDDIKALYEYLAGEPILSEQFTITVPDARVPGRDRALVDELTPRRIIEYVTGRADDNGTLYAWGRNRRSTENGSGNTNPMYEGEAVGGENVLNKGLMADDSSLYNSDAFRSAVSGPVDTGIHLEVASDNGTVIVHVKNDPPQSTETTPALTVSADGSSPEPADFDEWGAANGESAATATLVCPIMVAPPDCPSPFPALLYVRRHRNADQYIYTGGWLIDDGSLYENSATLVAVGGPTEVIGVDAGELDGDGYGDVLARRLSGNRERRGARLFDGGVSDAVAEGVLSETDGEDIILRKRPGRTAQQDGGTTDDVPVVIAQQGRLVHFTETTASDTAKFKAGAELSKSVN